MSWINFNYDKFSTLYFSSVVGPGLQVRGYAHITGISRQNNKNVVFPIKQALHEKLSKEADFLECVEHQFLITMLKKYKYKNLSIVKIGYTQTFISKF